MGSIEEALKHSENHNEYTYAELQNYPYRYLSIPENEREARAVFDHDTCVIDGKDWSIRGTVTIPVRNRCDDLRLDVWVTVSEKDFNRLRGGANSSECWAEGYIASRLPYYPDTLTAESPVILDSYFRQMPTAVYPYLNSDLHLLALDQKKGIPAVLANKIESMRVVRPLSYSSTTATLR
jgi:hypothetical protein